MNKELFENKYNKPLTFKVNTHLYEKTFKELYMRHPEFTELQIFSQGMKDNSCETWYEDNSKKSNPPTYYKHVTRQNFEKLAIKVALTMIFGDKEHGNDWDPFLSIRLFNKQELKTPNGYNYFLIDNDILKIAVDDYYEDVKYNLEDEDEHEELKSFYNSETNSWDFNIFEIQSIRLTS